MPLRRSPAPRKTGAEALQGPEEAAKKRRGRAAKAPDRCGEIKTPKGRKRRAANCAPRRFFPLGQREQAVPSRGRLCLPNGGCTQTRLFRLECSGACRFGREHRIRWRANRPRRLFSARRRRLQVALERTDWLTAEPGETSGRRFQNV